MNHRIKGRKLGRNSAHRKSLFRNLFIAIVGNGRIRTTVPKAKEVKPFIEKLVTAARIDTVANRRFISSKVPNQEIVKCLFEKVSPRFINRNGGYLRIIKCGFRVGDKAPMAYLEFVDHDSSRNESVINSKEKTY